MIVERNGLSFHVQLLGPEGAPPLAMLHGLIVGSLAGWYFGPAGRLARSHRVLLHDLRGHGRSSRTAGGYDTHTLAGDLESLLDLAGDGPVTLVGHSYGALVALRFALRWPERVARLALVEAPLPPSRAGELLAFVRRPPAEMIASLPAPLRESVAHEGRAGRALLERLVFLARESSLLDDLAREPDVPDAELGALRCPTLLVYGDRSSLLPVGDRLAAAIPGARLQHVPGGHFLLADAPGPLGDALEAFCDG